ARENGLDLLAPARTEQECGAWIRNHPHADALLVALAAWLTVGSPAEVTRLEEVIPYAVPRDDEVFARLQTAKLQPEVLELLARDVTILRPRTVEFLAIRLRMADRDERATDLLRPRIERYPLDARVRLRFLDLVEDRPAEEIEEAVLHLSVAVSLRPRSPAAHLKLGLALLKLGRHDDAIRSFRQARAAFARLRQTEPDLRSVGEDPLILTGLGDALTHRGHPSDFWEAACCLQQAAERDPDNPDIWFKLGTALLLDDNREGPEIGCTNAIGRAGPKGAAGPGGLGGALRRRRQADRPREASQEAARRAPTNPRPQVERGKELHRRKRFAEAEAAFGQALDA